MKIKSKKWLWPILLAGISFTAVLFYGILAPSAGLQEPVTTATEPTPGIALVKLIVALIFVLTLMLALAWLTKRYLMPHFFSKKANTHLQVLESLTISPKNRIVVAQVFDEILVLGVSEQNISLLSQISDVEMVQRLNRQSQSDQRPVFLRYLQRLG